MAKFYIPIVALSIKKKMRPKRPIFSVFALDLEDQGSILALPTRLLSPRGVRMGSDTFV